MLGPRPLPAPQRAGSTQEEIAWRWGPQEVWEREQVGERASQEARGEAELRSLYGARNGHITGSVPTRPYTRLGLGKYH